jgi:hypothetical protein
MCNRCDLDGTRRRPAMCAFADDRGSCWCVASVVVAENGRSRISQRLILRDSSVTIDTSAATLNSDFITEATVPC